MKSLFRKISNIIESSILCIRFPFLYPRNVYTGEHYNNWKISNYINTLYCKYKVYSCKDNSYDEVLSSKTKVYRLEKSTESGWCTYYKNWWSYYYIKFIEGFHSFLGIFHIIPTYTILDWMPEGWRKAFGIQLCKDIKRALLKNGRKALLNYRIFDVKEKYGSLRWDDSGATVEVTKILHKYEYISARTCIVCGELADVYTPIEYWLSPYCDKHAPTRSTYLIDFGIPTPYKEGKSTEYAMNWYGWTGNINRREDYEERQKKFQEYLNL